MTRPSALALIAALTGAVIFSLVVLAAPPLPGPSDKIDDFDCEAGQACRAEPPCPTESGECDSCSAYAVHLVCNLRMGYTCDPEPNDPDGCGSLRKGTCGVDNQCYYILTQIDCASEMCIGGTMP